MLLDRSRLDEIHIIECIKHLNTEYERYPSTKYILENCHGTE